MFEIKMWTRSILGPLYIVGRKLFNNFSALKLSLSAGWQYNSLILETEIIKFWKFLLKSKSVRCSKIVRRINSLLEIYLYTFPS